MTQADFMIDREQFSKLFPFYFLVDANMRVLQTGAVLARICPQFCVGQEMNDHFSLFDLSSDHAGRLTPELISHKKMESLYSNPNHPIYRCACNR